MQQFLLIFQLQWLLFKNSLRVKANRFELVARIIFGIGVLLFDLAIAVGLAFFGYVAYYRENMLPAMIFVFAAMFLYWQMIPLLTASFGGSGGFSISRLRLYPISNQQLFILDLFSGMVDPVALSIYLPLIGLLTGVALASPFHLPIALVGVLFFILFNVALSRYLQKLLERLLANRRSKEIFFVTFFLIMTGISLAPQLIFQVQMKQERATRAERRIKDRTRPEIEVDETAEHIRTLFQYLERFAWTPPGLAARAVVGLRNESWPARAGIILTSLGFTAIFLALSYRRLQSEFYGHSITKRTVAPTVLPTPMATSRPSDSIAATAVPIWARVGLLSPRAAIFEKELKYLYRSPRTVLMFISALAIGLVIVIPIMRDPTGTTSFFIQYLLAGVNFYALMIFAQVFNNSFGFDSHGAKQFYLAPVSGRDILIAKNLAIAAIILLQNIATTVIFHFVVASVRIDMLLNSLLISAIAMLIMLMAGNFISVLYPKTVDFTKMSGTAYSKMAMLLMMLVQGLVMGVISFGPMLAWATSSSLTGIIIFLVELVLVSIAYHVLLNIAAGLFEKRPDQFFKSLL